MKNETLVVKVPVPIPPAQTKKRKLFKIKADYLSLKLGRLEIELPKGTSTSRGRILFDGKETDFVQRIAIVIDAREPLPHIVMKVDPVRWEKSNRKDTAGA